MKDKIKNISNHEKDTGSSEVQIALLTDKILNFFITHIITVMSFWKLITKDIQMMIIFVYLGNLFGFLFLVIYFSAVQ